MIIKLYDTWRKAKQVFVKPSVRVYFGRWKNDPNLPVWRSGPTIYPLGYKFFCNHTYAVRESVLVENGVTTRRINGEEVPIRHYEHSVHKLPGGLRSWDTVWNRDIRKKLRKWHLSWLPHKIVLPTWCRFHIVNLDVVWKTKWDCVRYEFPPQFSIIAFGLSLTITLHGPKVDEYACDDHYWETILNYLYDKQNRNLKSAIKYTGVWTCYTDKKEGVSYFGVRPGYITSKYIEEYYAAISDIKRKEDKVIL